MSPRAKVLKNGICNMMRGGSAALVAIALPAFLTRSLPAQKYSAWVLALQFSAYISYFDAGIQTAIARYLAQCLAQNDVERRNRIVSSAALLLLGGMAIGLSFLTCFSFALPHLYPHFGQDILAELRLCMLVMGVSLAVGLFGSLFTGILIGLQRNEIPAVALGASRLAGALLIILAARQTNWLPCFALITAASNVMPSLIQAVVVKLLLPDLKLRLSLITRSVTRELVAYCTGLSTWTVGMLLVSGMDLTLVGMFDFRRVSAYSIASTLVLFLAGLNTSVFSSLLAPMAAMHARNERQQLANLVLRASRWAAMLNMVTATALLLFGGVLLRNWVPVAYADDALTCLRFLVVANALRTTFNPYSIAVISTGQHTLIAVSPLVEGLINLLVSAAAGWMYGAPGVAAGTLAGSVGGSIWTLFFNIPRTREVSIERVQFLQDALLRAAILAAPVCLVLAGTAAFGNSRWWYAFLVLASPPIGILLVRRSSGGRTIASMFRLRPAWR